MAPWQTSPLCTTSSRDAPGALLLFTLKTPTMLRRLRSGPTGWSWTAAESGWISQSQKDLTPQRLGFTWDGPHTAEVVPAVLGATRVTTIVAMIVDTTAGMTETAMTAMTTGVTTDHTGGDLRLRTTGKRTGLDQDPGLILPGDIDRFLAGKLLFAFQGQTGNTSEGYG